MTTATRGAHLLDPVLDLVADHGVGGLSVRTAATAAGVSPAQVQYYFRTKDELVAAAYRYAGEQFVSSLTGALQRDPSWRRLRTAVRHWLPLDPERERRAKVWLAFAATAAVSSDLRAEASEVDADLRRWFAGEFTALAGLGYLADGVDPDAAARHLLALIDGVTIEALVLPLPQRRALARTVDAYLDTLAPS